MSKNIIVENTGEGLIILPAFNVLTEKQMIIVPGVNEVDELTFNRIKNALSNHLESGRLVPKFAKETEVKGPKGEDGKQETSVKLVGEDFESLKSDQQIALVKKCNDISLLNKWANLPSVFKSTVAPVINEQIKKLTENPEQGATV